MEVGPSSRTRRPRGRVDPQPGAARSSTSAPKEEVLNVQVYIKSGGTYIPSSTHTAPLPSSSRRPTAHLAHAGHFTSLDQGAPAQGAPGTSAPDGREDAGSEEPNVHDRAPQDGAASQASVATAAPGASGARLDVQAGDGRTDQPASSGAHAAAHATAQGGAVAASGSGTRARAAARVQWGPDVAAATASLIAGSAAVEQVFQRQGRLTAELTALGLPPVYEHRKGVLVGKQVSTEPLTAAEARAVAGAAEADVLGLEGPQRVAQQPQLPPEPAWKRVRQRALNPAHNPVMARNIRVKAQLAQQAARVAAKKAATTNTSYRMLRYTAALDEASRTIAKLRVVSGAEELRMGSAPISKPYHPRRRRDGVPANETEGGDLLPGKMSKKLGITELGVYLPREVAAKAQAAANKAAALACARAGGAKRGTAAGASVPGGGATDGWEGAGAGAEDGAEEADDALQAAIRDLNRVMAKARAVVAATGKAVKWSMWLVPVVLQEDAKEGLVVVRYPAGTAVQRRRATERSPDRGMQAARDKAEKVRAARAASAYAGIADVEALRRPGTNLQNETTGGRKHGHQAFSQAPPAPPAAEPGEEGRLDRFTILSDDEDGGAVKGYQPRRRRGAPDPAATGGSNPAALLAGAADNLGWADSSSSDEEDPWGVDDVDEFGYPLEFVRQRKAAAGTDAEAPGVADSPERGGVAERGEGEGAGDETSSNGSWGVDYQHLGGAQHLQQGRPNVPLPDQASLAAHCAPAALTPETLQQLAAAKLAQHAASSASGAEGSAAQLLAEFGLAKERVPHPNDIPPLAFAAPPAWLTKPIPDFYEYYRDSPKPMATDSDADSVVVVAASGAGWNSGAAGAPGQLKQKSVGRVQDALQQAKRQQAARVVDHDAYTFHFTAPPDGV
eukprot:XP_001693209.1 predicted protein [Chlamydomonas reinhardtii]